MAWKFDNPLHSLATEDQNQKAQELWEAESLGGITEDNNRLPQPIIALLVLTIISAFMITFPLWGQRPHAAIYDQYISMMDSAEVAGKSDEEAMAIMVAKAKSSGNEYQPLLERHPLAMDDLRMIKDQYIELKNAGADLREYNVLGNEIVMANFEGNMIEDNGKMRRERIQPWWDLGYTIDIFFIIIFCVSVFIAVKRLPSHGFKPDHTKAH